METQLLKLDKPYEIICNQNGRFGLHIATLIVIKEERYRDAKTKQPSEDTYLKTSSYPVVGGGVGIEGKVWMGSELKDCQAVCREGGTAGLYTLKSIMEHCSKVSIFEMLLDIPITFSTSLMIYHAKFELPKDAKKRTINDYVVRLEFTESKNGASCMAYAAKESDFYFYAYFDNEPPFSYPATTNTDAIAFLAELRDVYLLAFRTEGLRSITFTTNDKKYQWFVDKLNSTKADAAGV